MKKTNPTNASVGGPVCPLYPIPDKTWQPDKLKDYAKEQYRVIFGAETFVTPYYWRLGRAIELAYDTLKLTRTHRKQLLRDWDIDKVRASKARAIAQAYSSPEELATIPVHEAYAQIVAKRREEKKQKQIEQGQVATSQDQSPEKEEAQSVTSILVDVTGRLDRLFDDIAFDGLRDDDHDQVVDQINRAIAALENIKNSLKTGTHHEEQ